MAGLRRERVEARTDDGWVLHGELTRPREDPRACAVLGHAMMVDRRTMDRRGEGLASTLAGRGIAALSWDLRGHGDSGPTAREGARWSYDAFVRHDLPCLVADARGRFQGLAVTVVGHSLAGHAAMIAAGLFPARAPDAIVGLAANLWAPRLERSLRRRLEKGATLAAWTAMTFPRGWFDPRWLSMGTDAEPWPYVWQFLRNYLRDELRSLDGHDDYLAALGRAEVPVLSISSEGDQLLASPEAVRRFTDAMVRAEVTHRVITRRDVDRPPGHMGVVTDLACRPIWEEIAEWILEGARRSA